MNRYLFLFSLVVLMGCGTPPPLTGWLPVVPGHAHNDYLHDHPLQDALHYGFRSVEADVHLRGDQLMVAHTRFGIRKQRTLESLYLEPLKQMVTQHPDSIPKHYGQIMLCVEIKTDFEPTFARLKQVLEKYKNIISTYENGIMHEKQVKVVLLEKHDFAMMEKEPYRLYTVDGWTEDLGKYNDANLVSVICLKPNKDLVAQVQQAHQHGQLVRAWGDFDNQLEWKEMYDAGVDFVHTDMLKEYNEFVRIQRAKK